MKQRYFQVENLSIALPKQEPFFSVSFSLDAGESLVIVGPNGCGKSTLLKCLAGVYPNAGGKFSLNGMDLLRVSLQKRAKCIGYVPQRFEPSVGYSVLEFLDIARVEERDSEMDSAIVQCSLKGLEEKRITELSGGELQRVLIASALIRRPKLLLLDEPSSHLDPKYQNELLELLHSDHTVEKPASILVTHDLNFAQAVADRMIVLSSGGIHYDGAVSDPEALRSMKDVFEADFQANFSLFPSVFQRLL